MEDGLTWIMISNGRRPPMEGNLQWKTTSNGKVPPMEDDLQVNTASNGRQDNLQMKITQHITTLIYYYVTAD